MKFFLIPLSIKFTQIFNEKLTLYENNIKIILNINDISEIRPSYIYLNKKIENFQNTKELDINQWFISRLKYEYIVEI